MKQIVLAVSVLVSYSQQTPPPTPPPVQQVQQIDRAMAALDVLQKQAELMTAKKNYQCMSAVGSTPFCGCITQELPIAVSFQGYVTITTQSKEELGYTALSTEDKNLVDLTMATRDKCVAKAFPPK